MTDPALKIRRAVADDYVSFVQLFPELRVNDPIPTREHWDATMAPESWVAEDADGVVAYAHCQEFTDAGYLRQIVVAPRQQRRGVGRAMLAALFRHLHAAGKTSCRLNVKRDNLAALALYRSMGFEIAYPSVALLWPVAAFAKLERHEAQVVELKPERDREAEQVFGLPAGQLESARGLRRELLTILDAAGQLQALAVVAGHYAFAFPLHLRDIRLAEPMLRAIARLAPPETGHLSVVVEDDEPFAVLLIASGAEVRHETYHLVAPFS
jgi:GNAT superfamily N-acetyltransferase